MKLRTFMAGSMAEALAMVKAQIGPGAVILHTRTYRRGGIMGLGGKNVVEITATDGSDPALKPRREMARPAGRRAEVEPTAGDLIRRTYAVARAELSKQQQQAAPALAPEAAPPAPPFFAARAPSAPPPRMAVAPGAMPTAVPIPMVMPSSALALTPAAAAARPPTHVAEPHSAMATASAPPPVTASAATLPAAPLRSPFAVPAPTPAASMLPTTPVHVAANDDLVREMRAVHRMVARLARRQPGDFSAMAAAGPGGSGRFGGSGSGGPGGLSGIVNASGAPTDMPDKLFDQYLALLRQEVTEELAEQVIIQVCQKLSPEEIDDAPTVRRAVLEAVATHIPIDELAGNPIAPGDGRPRTIALVGPTGVGKTTTVAKLAATFKLKQKLSVGLITLDTYRIAAVEQLRTYANIIGVPLQVVMTPEELAAALRRCATGPNRCDVVLIDTAGRSQRDDPRLDQLRDFIRVADPHEVHLVLSSTCSQTVLLETVERFSSIRTDRIIFTKLDEAVSFGVMLNVASKVNKRLSYVTTGQEVPHQIEPGRSERLAELVLGGGV